MNEQTFFLDDDFNISSMKLTNIKSKRFYPTSSIKTFHIVKKHAIKPLIGCGAIVGGLALMVAGVLEFFLGVFIPHHFKVAGIMELVGALGLLPFLSHDSWQVVFDLQDGQSKIFVSSRDEKYIKRIGHAVDEAMRAASRG